MKYQDPILENQWLIRKALVSEKREIIEAERAVVAYGNTKAVDAYREVLLPSGWIFTRFAKNPVMPWSHNYRLPPVGRALWWKTDNVGLLFKGQFAQTQMADEVWGLYRDGFLTAFSVGYDQLEYVTAENNQEEFNRLVEENGLEGDIRLIGIKQELWEISPVVLPANADAVVQGIREKRIKSKAFVDSLAKMIEDEGTARELGHTKDMIIEIVESSKEPARTQVMAGIEIIDGIEKGVTPFADLPTAPEDTSWDASKARQNVAKWASSDGSGDKEKINWAKFRKAFFWYDAEDAENFRAYKLPFADVIGGNLKAVWRGVAASMAALLGARGGVDIPDSDRKAVYNHIAKYYEKFGKEIPEFKNIDALEEIRRDIDEIKDAIVGLYARLEDKKETQEKPPEISFEEAMAHIEIRVPELIEREIRRLRGKVD